MVKQQKHLVLVGRLVGTDEGWVDCTCGWHFEGTIQAARSVGEEHMKGRKLDALHEQHPLLSE